MASRYPQRSRKPFQQIPSQEAGKPVTEGSLDASGHKPSQLGRPTSTLNVSRLFNASSPLIDIDLQPFFSACMETDHWNAYSAKEKASIIQSLPTTRRPPTGAVDGQNPWPNPPISAEFCLTDSHFKSCLARFKRDLEDRYYEKSWQRMANNAQRARSEGAFDHYLEQGRDEMFGHDEPAATTPQETVSDSETSEYQDGRAMKSRVQGT